MQLFTRIALALLALTLAPGSLCAQTVLPMVLVTHSELAALEATALAEAEKNRSRQCIRPVLTGQPVQGSADQAIVEIVESEAHHKCYQAMEDHAEAVTAYLEGPADKAARAPAEVVSACLALPAAMARAVQHVDACSPYLFGRRAQPQLISVARGGRGLAVLIRNEGAAGNWGAAIDIALNGLRFYQDLNRGPGASLIIAMVSTAASDAIIEQGLRPLLEKGIPGEADFSRLTRGVSALLATDPPFCDTLAYERFGLPLQMMLPALKGEGWTPPGGFDHNMSPPAQDPATASLGLAPGQEMALAWVAMEEVHDRFSALCKAHHRVAGLYQAMHSASVDITSRVRESQWRRLFRLFVSSDPQKELRAWIVDILTSVAIPSFDKYVLRYAQRRFKLQGLRLQLLVARYSVANNVCPSLKGLEHPDFAPATVDPGSGKPMVIRIPQNGILDLYPAQETLDAAKDDEKVGHYRFSCPIS